MKNNKIYIVTFEIHRDCMIMNFVYYCYAANAKEACASCKHNWDGDGHQFHVHAVKSRIQDVSLLTLRSFWKAKYVSGEALINEYWMTDSRTWRVKTSNGYIYPLAKGIY